jgi:cation:H+ antiporter
VVSVDGLWSLLLVLGGVGALWYGALVLVESAVLVARRLGLSETVVGVLVVGVGTSLPEVAVTVDAAILGAPDIAVANVVGSNFFNLGIVLGAVALVRAVPVRGRVLRRDGVVLLTATVLASYLLLDRSLSPVEGGVLLVGLVGYLWLLLTQGDPASPDAAAERVTPLTVLKLLGGLALVLLGADVLVRGAATLARGVGLSEWVIGLTVVAAGTSTPGVAASVGAARRGNTGLSVGNLVGSSTFNVLAVLGVAGVFGPLSVASNATGGMVWLVGLVVLALVLLRTDRELGRLEGALLVCVALSRWVVDLLGIGVP